MNESRLNIKLYSIHHDILALLVLFVHYTIIYIPAYMARVKYRLKCIFPPMFQKLAILAPKIYPLCIFGPFGQF